MIFFSHPTHLIGRAGAWHRAINIGPERRHPVVDQPPQPVELEDVDRAVLVFLLDPLPLSIILEFHPVIYAIDAVSQRIGPVVAVRVDLGPQQVASGDLRLAQVVP